MRVVLAPAPACSLVGGVGVTQRPRLFRLMGMIDSQIVTDAEVTYRRLAPELTRYATGLVGPFDAMMSYPRPV